ncbi:hypothetical protein [Aliiroseovarius sp. S253]|uniref:hypothetical protein n=1 Tax=Aliiroseovarius sp. S253 TaxID=3415133 RepID=UPI003C7D77C9
MRLQPKHIPEQIEKRLEEFDRFKSDTAVLNLLRLHSGQLANLSARLNQAVLLWSNSAVLKQVISDADVLDKYFPAPSIQDDELAFWAKAEALNNSSTIFRTYVSVVLGRSEELVSALGDINREQKDHHLKSALKLLRDDEVRRLRNAISHGTFVAHGSELEYWDDNEKRRFSFPELDALNFAIFKVILLAWGAVAPAPVER